jgi:hypothetical protein
MRRNYQYFDWHQAQYCDTLLGYDPPVDTGRMFLGPYFVARVLNS